MILKKLMFRSLLFIDDVMFSLIAELERGVATSFEGFLKKVLRLIFHYNRQVHFIQTLTMRYLLTQKNPIEMDRVAQSPAKKNRLTMTCQYNHV